MQQGYSRYSPPKCIPTWPNSQHIISRANEVVIILLYNRPLLRSVIKYHNLHRSVVTSRIEATVTRRLHVGPTVWQVKLLTD